MEDIYTEAIERGRWYNLEDSTILQRGDFVDILFHPISQKHFFSSDYTHYFPQYFGKVMSNNNREMEDILIKEASGKEYYFQDRCGTSGMMTAKFYRPANSNDFPKPPEQHPYNSFLEDINFSQ